MIKKSGKYKVGSSSKMKYTKPEKNYKYWGIVHEPHRCLACGETVQGRWANHFERVWRSVNRQVTREVDREGSRAVNVTYQNMEQKIHKQETSDAVRSKIFNFFNAVRSKIFNPQSEISNTFKAKNKK